MGQVRTVMVTGASGFIGRAVVAEALAQGLEVVAIVRSTVPQDWRGLPHLTVFKVDLSDASTTDTLSEMMEVDTVIHAAAHLGSDVAQQERDTMQATENVLHAMMIAGIKHMVLVSSLAVYDTSRLWPGASVTETTPLEDADHARDGYVRGKLNQEALCQRSSTRRGTSLAILRPGAVFGEGRTWNDHLGFGAGPVLLRVGGGGEVPLCHVTTCARAIVAAAVGAVEGVVNVLDDDRPRRGRFLRAHRMSGWPQFVVPVPWWLMLPAAYLAKLLPFKKPGLLRPRVLKARMMPLRYPNDAMHRMLNIPESPKFESLLDAALARGQS